MYPEYLYVLEHRASGTAMADMRQPPRRLRGGTALALAHGLVLLDPTPFGDTFGIAVTHAYGAGQRLRSLEDLRRVARLADPRGAAAVPAGRAARPARGSSGATASRRRRSRRWRSATSTAPRRRHRPGRLRQHHRRRARHRRLPAAARSRSASSASATSCRSSRRRRARAEGPAFAATINRVNALLTHADDPRAQPAGRRRRPGPGRRRQAVPADARADSGRLLLIGAGTPDRQRPLEPNPPSPRVEIPPAPSPRSGPRALDATITSWAIRSPAAPRRWRRGSVLSSSTRSSPR